MDTGRRESLGSVSSIQIGSENAKLVPSLTLLSMVSSPPISSTSRLQIASPNPVPPNFLEIDASACSKALNNLVLPVSLMPMPVSLTLKPSSLPRLSILSKT